ncbi:hypothetical protein LDENG_00105770 [Lucifuga dentata]|nr:hypothetical protein LDENG_00105770 [Lucifuga dentata]
MYDPASRLTSSPRQQQRPVGNVSVKTNRLSRSFRQTQQPPVAADSDSPKRPQPDFKTPTRLSRPKYVSGESPHNDSDLQQDIIWDATSPSPIRLGKRGKKHPAYARAVDISEIVSRIAPEQHGRPKVAEPTLQQWIGDSADIPCTPDVPLPKPKRKSPRSNRVDDLLKLAKQFDFSMFHQDEEEADDVRQQSLELLSEEVLDFENGNENNVSPLLPENSEPAVNKEKELPVCVGFDHEDDLDFLFDGLTQRLSGNLSQVSLAQPSQVKSLTRSSRDAPGRAFIPSLGPLSEVSTTHAKVPSADDFEDDWENDDFLNDSLVIEMTQNPHKFEVPKHTSTQKASGGKRYQCADAGNIPAVCAVRLGTSTASNMKQRTTFKLEPNPNFPAKKTPTDKNTNFKSFSNGNMSAVSSGKAAPVQTNSQPNRQTCCSNVLKSNPQQSTSIIKYDTSTSTKHFTTKPSDPKPTEHKEVPADPVLLRTSDFLNEDLDSFFLSDSVWDNQDDDALLCEMCEDLENQIQSAENLSTKQTPSVCHTASQRPVLVPSNRNKISQNKWPKHLPANQQPASEQGGTCMEPFPKKQTVTPLPSGSGRPANGSLAGNGTWNHLAGFHGNAAKESFRRTLTTSCSTFTSSSRNQSASVPTNAVKDQTGFTFKKPNGPVAMVTSKAMGKCTAAEIEQKKQQALERRRQRMQNAQNLRVPT